MSLFCKNRDHSRTPVKYPVRTFYHRCLARPVRANHHLNRRSPFLSRLLCLRPRNLRFRHRHGQR